MTVENVRDLLQRRRRHIQLRLAPGTPPPNLSWVPGLADVVHHGDVITATLQGDVGPFLRAITPATVTDLTVEPARLEEAFLEYYAESGETDGAAGR